MQNRALIPWNYSAGYLAANAEALAKREAAIAALPRSWFTSFAGLCDALLLWPTTIPLGSLSNKEIPSRTYKLCHRKPVFGNKLAESWGIGYDGLCRLFISGIEYRIVKRPAYSLLEKK